jgi:chromosome segregation ATPase
MQVNQGCAVSDFLPTRVDKALAWLERSRDTWKDKCRQAKLLLKRQTFAAKRLKEGRNAWRLSSIRLKQELSESKDTISTLREHIKNLESQVETFRNETIELKKKSSRTM